jgi:hypothetical protein
MSSRRRDVTVPSHLDPQYHFVYRAGDGWVAKTEAKTDGGTDE